MKSQKKFYAYLIPSNRKYGVTDNWAACEKEVRGIENARFRGFKTKEEAERWLTGGAQYEVRVAPKLEPGIYFDAGTGRGDGVEVSVTDETGKNLLHKVLPKRKVNVFGKHLVGEEVSNNYGELLACRYALQLALEDDVTNVFGDSKLVIDYWSKGHSKKEDLELATVKLIGEVKKLRKQFEAAGGTVGRVSGDYNPADLGFHR